MKLIGFISFLVVLSLCPADCQKSKKCPNQEKMDKISAYLKNEFNTLCSDGTKPGSKKSHVDYANKLIGIFLSKETLGSKTPDVPDRKTLLKQVATCNNQCTKKGGDYCSKETTKCFKDCIIPKVMFMAIGLNAWFEKNCPTINEKLVEPYEETNKKFKGYIDEFRKLK